MSGQEIMVECRGCGIQNIFNNYTPEDFLVCNQCRERLIEFDFCETYRQFDCRDCGLIIFILNQTDFKIGNSACRCKGTNYQEKDPRPFLHEAEKAGGLGIKNEPLDDSSEWYRSETVREEDYDEMFDRDMGDDDPS